MSARPLDLDTIAALEEERDFLLRSLDDLEREHDAGDVDDHDYLALKDDYTARAARVIRALEERDAGEPVRRTERSPRSWARAAAVACGIVVFAVLAGVLVAQAAGRREAGDPVTGEIRETVRTRLDEALALANERDYDAAIEIYDEVLAQQPGNVEALTFKGWAQFLSGDGSGVVTLVEAAEADPDYPPVHAFLAIAFNRLGRPETALLELDRLEALDPPPEISRMVEGMRQDLERQVAERGG